MQPKPSSETSSPWPPSVRVFISSPFGTVRLKRSQYGLAEEDERYFRDVYDQPASSLSRSVTPPCSRSAQTGSIRARYVKQVRALIKEKREVAKGTLLVVFDLLGREVDFKPGQYFWVTLLDPPYEDEKGPRRHISVVTSPNERGVLGLCTRLRDSAFKRSLAELPLGAEVDVEEPKGSFLLPEDTDQRFVFIAGGIGITVFRCMLRYITEEQLSHRVTLVYSNRDRESAAFLDELVELEHDNPNLQLVLTMTDDPAWDGESRRIGVGLLQNHLGDELQSLTYLIAGPPPMVEGVVGTLQAAGVPEAQLRPDRFSGY